MHVFIDDSGDGGFKVGQGSSSHLVMSAVVFRSPEEIEKLKELTEGCKARHRFGREVKFAKTKAAFKQDYFDCISSVDFAIRAVVMDKAIIHSAHLRSSPAAFKSHAIRQLLTHTDGSVFQAKVVVDGQDTKAFGIHDREYLARMANKNNVDVVRHVSFQDSRTNVGLQLADMTAGAINAARRSHKPSNDEFLKVLTRQQRFVRPRGSLWDFK